MPFTSFLIHLQLGLPARLFRRKNFNRLPIHQFIVSEQCKILAQYRDQQHDDPVTIGAATGIAAQLSWNSAGGNKRRFPEE